MDSHFSQYEMGLDQRNTELMSGTPPVQGYASAPGTNTQNGTDSMSPYESSAAMTSPALPPRPNQQPDDHLKKQLHDLHHALAAEVSKNKQYQDLLSQSHNQAEEVNQALSQTTAEVEEYKALWKQSARDLNSHLVNDRGFKPFDDKFFIDKVTLLRRNIRDFAYQYYDNWPADIKVSSNPIREMADMLDLDPNYMCRDLSPSSVVRAYIWGFLGQHVFGRAFKRIISSRSRRKIPPDRFVESQNKYIASGPAHSTWEQQTQGVPREELQGTD
ncbi:hypothetical protein RAB80_017758 [Fusarium oxysporum f. sp. vasinfectum]|nr:hypothetical protein RAB80_017758 [Fusarium oxysporum f. sp. vasinfectum]